MAQLKTGTKIGQTTINQGSEIAVTLPADAGTLLTNNALNNTQLTGTPTAPTASPGTSTTQLATTEFVQSAAYIHPTTAGNKHIPSGGAAGQILKYSADGTAVWGDSTSGASVTTYSVTIPSASWTGSSAPYTKTVTVTGLLATDEPIIDVNLTGTYATDQTIRTDWSKVYDGDTATNSITFYADSVPTADIPVRIKVIR